MQNSVVGVSGRSPSQGPAHVSPPYMHGLNYNASCLIFFLDDSCDKRHPLVWRNNNRSRLWRKLPPRCVILVARAATAPRGYLFQSCFICAQLCLLYAGRRWWPRILLRQYDQGRSVKDRVHSKLTPGPSSILPRCHHSRRVGKCISIYYNHILSWQRLDIGNIKKTRLIFKFGILWLFQCDMCYCLSIFMA